MRITLVGVRRGRRTVVWRSVLKLALVVVPIPAVVVPLIYLAVRKLWEPAFILFGAAAGAGIVVLVVIGAACTELRRLPILPEDKPPSE